MVLIIKLCHCLLLFVAACLESQDAACTLHCGAPIWCVPLHARRSQLHTGAMAKVAVLAWGTNFVTKGRTADLQGDWMPFVVARKALQHPEVGLVTVDARPYCWFDQEHRPYTPHKKPELLQAILQSSDVAAFVKDVEKLVCARLLSHRLLIVSVADFYGERESQALSAALVHG